MVKVEQEAQVQLQKKKRIQSGKSRETKEVAQTADGSGVSEASNGIAEQDRAAEQHRVYESHLSTMERSVELAEETLSRVWAVMDQRRSNRQTVATQAGSPMPEEEIHIKVQTAAQMGLRVSAQSLEATRSRSSLALCAALGCIVGYWIASRRARG
mmetsp:Transcript_1151/g.3608  ORF Transcript_1151/g.3608 Transcript_1151/m.3608 type:complete len:156 (-) Transcript_1151:77-544(-)